MQLCEGVNYSERDLLARAVRSARAITGGSNPRWVCVMDTFSLGSTAAHGLCREFDLDPDEKVRK